jgi:hypothetical protein
VTAFFFCLFGAAAGTVKRQREVRPVELVLVVKRDASQNALLLPEHGPKVDSALHSSRIRELEPSSRSDLYLILDEDLK